MTKVRVSFVDKPFEIWVKCFGAFGPIYKVLEDSQYTESKVYDYTFQWTKLLVNKTSKLRDIQILVRLCKQEPEVGP